MAPCSTRFFQCTAFKLDDRCKIAIDEGNQLGMPPRSSHLLSTKLCWAFDKLQPNKFWWEEHKENRLQKKKTDLKKKEVTLLTVAFATFFAVHAAILFFWTSREYFFPFSSLGLGGFSALGLRFSLSIGIKWFEKVPDIWCIISGMKSHTTLKRCRIHKTHHSLMPNNFLGWSFLVPVHVWALSPCSSDPSCVRCPTPGRNSCVCQFEFFLNGWSEGSSRL